MEYPPNSATQCEHENRGRTISFTCPPPPWMRNTLVALTVSKGAPFLSATLGDGGRVVYSIQSPNRETLTLFALIENSKRHIASRDKLMKYVKRASERLGPCKWDDVEHDCPVCGVTESSRGLFFKDRHRKTADAFRLCYSSCPRKGCRTARTAIIIDGLFAPEKYKKKGGGDTTPLENILRKNLASALESLRCSHTARFACVLNTQQRSLATCGFALQLSHFCDDTLDYMFTVNSNPDFSPDFSTKHMRSLYETLVRLQSWHFPQTTMAYLPPVGRQPALETPVCRKFVEKFQGEPILNANNTYMVCRPDRTQAQGVCNMYFSKNLQNNLSFELYWRWPLCIETYDTNGVWFDVHTGTYAAPIPDNMEVCKSLGEFCRKMKSSISNFYVANAQELDFIMMRELLGAVSTTDSTCQMLGLVAPVGAVKTARMNGRPFLFFCWWNQIRATMPQYKNPVFRLSTPPIDATLDELATALPQSSLENNDHNREILSGAIDAWHHTHWPGVEYTVSRPPPRVRSISAYQSHPTDGGIDMRSCNGQYSIRISSKTPGVVCCVKRGNWEALCRSSVWAPIPTAVAADTDARWFVAPIPSARFSQSLHVFSAVDPDTVKPSMAKLSSPLSKLGLFLTASIKGITQDLSDFLKKLIKRPHIIVPSNRNADAAVSIALDCYHAAVNSPSPVKFCKVRDKKRYKESQDRFVKNLTTATNWVPKHVAGSVCEIYHIYETLVLLDSKQKTKKRKSSSIS